MLARARKAGVPAAWVTADAVYGGDRPLRRWLEEPGQAFVLEIACNEPLWAGREGGPGQVRAAALAAELPAAAWERLSAGAGAKGPRLYDWARVRLGRPGWPDWEHWLLVRRSLRHPEERAYYVVFCPAGTPLAELVRVAGSRWAIEECLESAKGEVGLDQYEVRKWGAWYRFITLALLAHAYLTVLRSRALLTGAKGGCGSVSRAGARGSGTAVAADRPGSAPPVARVSVAVRAPAGAAPALVLVAAPSSRASATLSLPKAAGRSCRAGAAVVPS